MSMDKLDKWIEFAVISTIGPRSQNGHHIKKDDSLEPTFERLIASGFLQSSS
jgi:hypothetical protein